MSKGKMWWDHDAVWEMETADGEVRYYVTQYEAESAARDVVARGLSTRVAPIPMPTTRSDLCDLLTNTRDKAKGQR